MLKYNTTTACGIASIFSKKYAKNPKKFQKIRGNTPFCGASFSKNSLWNTKKAKAGHFQ